MKASESKTSTLFAASLGSITFLAIPFLIFLVLVSREHYTLTDRPEESPAMDEKMAPAKTKKEKMAEAKTKKEKVAEAKAKEENLAPTNIEPEPPEDPGKVVAAFFDKNPDHAKIRFLIATYGQNPLTVESLKGLAVDFVTLFTDDELKSAVAEEEPAAEDPPPAAEKKAATPAPAPAAAGVPWYSDAESRPFAMLTRYAIFSAAAMMGALGATISLLTRSRTGPHLPFTIQHVLGLQIVGAVFACLLALFFAGGLISGVLFPTSTLDSPNGWFTVVYLHSQFAKLLVWSFLAGFSERLMPDLFQSFVERFNRENSPEEQQPNVAR